MNCNKAGNGRVKTCSFVSFQRPIVDRPRNQPNKAPVVSAIFTEPYSNLEEHPNSALCVGSRDCIETMTRAGSVFVAGTRLVVETPLRPGRKAVATMAQPAMPICRERGLPGRSHSCSFDHRRRPEMLRTAMATAFFWPTSTTNFLPRVTPV